MVPIDPVGELNDQALAGEIVLLGELVLAATSTGGRMRQVEVDRALGLDPSDDEVHRSA